jgi:hypothetical protein
MIRPRFIGSLFLFAFAFIFSAQTFAQDRAQLAQEIDSLKQQLKAKEIEFLEPSPQDKAAFDSFLSQPDTGLIRLLPRETNQNKLSINGGGAYYSFSRLTHEYGYGSDISLEQGRFSVGFAGAAFGFLLSLGNTSIESVDSENPGLNFLLDFTPPLQEPKARKQQQRANAGFSIDEHFYINRLEVKENTTYALRSIDYGHSDLLIALRVVRKDVDGSLIIAWKLLKKFPIPQLINS